MDSIEVEVRPRSPFRLPRLTGGDCLIRKSGAAYERLIADDGSPVIARIRPIGGGRYLASAEAVMPETVSGPGSAELQEAGPEQLEAAIGRLRFAIGIDLDLGPMRDSLGDDPLLGPALEENLTRRPQRRPAPWEALLWAITEQLIEYRRAAAIQRAMIRRWGLQANDGLDLPRRGRQDGILRTVPSPRAIAGASPAELEACGLSARRAIATVKVAREVATGRADLDDSGDDRRLLAIPDIGDWTMACLGLRGRGEPDALLAGDLGQVKLVGYLEGLGRNAEIDEVESFYESYRPYRGLAGEYLLSAYGRPVYGPGNTARIARGAGSRGPAVRASGPPARRAA